MVCRANVSYAGVKFHVNGDGYVPRLGDALFRAQGCGIIKLLNTLISKGFELDDGWVGNAELLYIFNETGAPRKFPYSDGSCEDMLDGNFIVGKWLTKEQRMSTEPGEQSVLKNIVEKLDAEEPVPEWAQD